jgi:hypothetical protein
MRVTAVAAVGADTNGKPDTRLRTRGDLGPRAGVFQFQGRERDLLKDDWQAPAEMHHDGDSWLVLTWSRASRSHRRKIEPTAGFEPTTRCLQNQDLSRPPCIALCRRSSRTRSSE